MQFMECIDWLIALKIFSLPPPVVHRQIFVFREV